VSQLAAGGPAPRRPGPAPRRTARGPATQVPGWTTPADVLAQLTKRWQAGTFLAALAGGAPFEPIGLPVRGPVPGEIAGSFAAVADWAGQWQRLDREPLRVEYARVGGRVIGANEIPCRVWIDSYEQLWAVLKVASQVRRFTELADSAGEECPRIVPWMVAHPMRVLALQGCWSEIVATVRWIDERQRPGEYLRQVDVPGVDTKFIERHRGVLADLLDAQLGPGRADTSVPRADFAGRYLFARKPQYVRFRLAAGVVSLGPFACSEISLRTTELTAPPPGVRTVFVVENEITYLAFPVASDAMVIFGGGYAVSVLESLGWLADVDLRYWGDIDTHGFAILNRLRGRFGHARSMLMDRATLLAHQGQWVTEPNPVVAALDLLDPQEAALYRDLADHRLGRSVRLEQERISFAALRQALASGQRESGHSAAGRPPAVT